MSVKPVPEGYHSVSPYLIVDGAATALAFYQEAFGATEVMRLDHPEGGKIMHAEMRIGDSPVMLADEFPDMGIRGPRSLGGSGVGLLIYVENVDEQFNRAIESGAKELRPVKDQFYGDRSGTLEDPFGHIWTIATRTEDLTPQEIENRFNSSMQA